MIDAIASATALEIDETLFTTMGLGCRTWALGSVTVVSLPRIWYPDQVFGVCIDPQCLTPDNAMLDPVILFKIIAILQYII